MFSLASLLKLTTIHFWVQSWLIWLKLPHKLVARNEFDLCWQIYNKLHGDSVLCRLWLRRIILVSITRQMGKKKDYDCVWYYSCYRPVHYSFGPTLLSEICLFCHHGCLLTKKQCLLCLAFRFDRTKAQISNLWFPKCIRYHNFNCVHDLHSSLEQKLVQSLLRYDCFRSHKSLLHDYLCARESKMATGPGQKEWRNQRV